MTGQSVPYRIPDPAPLTAGPQDAARHAPELQAAQCTRCGALGTHYLTCPGLRLPPGYRLSADSAPLSAMASLALVLAEAP